MLLDRAALRRAPRPSCASSDSRCRAASDRQNSASSSSVGAGASVEAAPAATTPPPPSRPSPPAGGRPPPRPPPRRRRVAPQYVWPAARSSSTPPPRRPPTPPRSPPGPRVGRRTRSAGAPARARRRSARRPRRRRPRMRRRREGALAGELARRAVEHDGLVGAARDEAPHAPGWSGRCGGSAPALEVVRGFQSESKRMTASAAVRLMPTPPALVESRKTNASSRPPVWKRSIDAWRSFCATEPSSRSHGRWVRAQ